MLASGIVMATADMATVATSRLTADPTIVEFDVRTDEMLVNMGPQHPSTHGVLRLVLRTDGEVISEVTPHLGYLHRCAEKIGENVTPIQFIPYTDRMDYLAGMNMNLAYSLAVEKLCGMKMPEKAQVIRVIIAEMNRIASHLVGMGAYGLDLGTFSPFLYAFREREMILDLFEEVCGARLTYSYITIGGVHDDLPEGWVERCQQFLDYLKPRIDEYHALLTTNHIFVQAHGQHRHPVEGDGAELRLHRADAARLARPQARATPTGTCARSSRTAATRPTTSRRSSRRSRRLLRRAVPHAAGAVIGDCWHRFYVRMLEVVESIKIVEQALKRYPTAQGSHRIEPPKHLPAGRGLRRDGVPARPDGLLRRRQLRARSRCRCACGRGRRASAT